MSDQTQNSTAQTHAAHWSTEDLTNNLKTSDKPIFIDFYAEWCGPCKLAAPIIDKLSGEYQDRVTIVKLDVDEYNDAARQYGVMSIPTVLVFDKKDGAMVEVNRKIGFPGEAGYRQMLNAVASPAAGANSSDKPAAPAQAKAA
jgi:thioredoxin 1